jgi:type IV pilus assembly protein PilW
VEKETKRKVETQQGFTVLELLMALSLSLLTLGAALTIYLSQVKTQTLQDNVITLQSNIRSAGDLLSREIRMAGYDPAGVNKDESSSNDFRVIEVKNNQLLIHSDLNGNGVMSDPNETITYSYDEGTKTLRRSTGGGRQTVADHIVSVTFQAIDTQGKPVSLASSARGVKIGIEGRTAQPDPSYPKNEGYRTLTWESVVALRN